MKLQRLLAILSLLCERDKATAQELADRFEVSKRRVSSKKHKKHSILTHCCHHLWYILGDNILIGISQGGTS